MFKMLEKLINEHGSAKILKERLGLKDDQISSLKQEFSTLIQENKDVKAENQNLVTQLNNANTVISTLKESINSNTESHSSSNLKDIEIQILQFFFDKNEEIEASQIAHQFNIQIGNTEYHINKLLEQELIINSLSPYGTTYEIGTNGRAYIIENT